jgi:integron integrase
MASVPLACKTSREPRRVSVKPSSGQRPKRVCLSFHEINEVWTMEQRPKKLLDHVRDAIRLKHYSLHTEQS